MQEHKRLAQLILDQILRDESHPDWERQNHEIAELLERATAHGPSRLALRKQLSVLARDTNAATYRDIADAISESLADRVRDLEHQIGKLDNEMLPSRFAMGTTIGLILGAIAAATYGSADILTASGFSGIMVLAFFALQAYRKRAFGTISALRAKRANFESFRNLLRHDP